MRKTFVFWYLALGALIMLIVMLASWRALESSFFRQMEEDIRTSGQILKKIAQEELQEESFSPPSFVAAFSLPQQRLTIISEAGEVLADSYFAAEEMDNHYYRAEITALRKGEEPLLLRYSATLQKYFYYHAFAAGSGEGLYYFRLAVPQERLQKELQAALLPIFVALLAGWVIAGGIGYSLWHRNADALEKLIEHIEKTKRQKMTGKIYVDGNEQIQRLKDAVNELILKSAENDFLLESRNAELEAMLKSIRLGLIALRDDYRITVYNEAILQIFSVQKGDLTGQPFYKGIRNPEVFEVLERAAEEKKATEAELKLEENGKTKHIRLLAMPIVAEDKRFLGSLLVAENITEIRRLERIRQDFVSNVSHELKTPLTAIKGFVSELKDGAIKDSAVAQRFLDIIEIETDRLTALIGDILLLSDIESMKKDMAEAEISLIEVADEVIDLLQPQLKQKGLSLCREYQSNLPEFCGSFDRMKQLLLNLMDNAIKYTREGRIVLRLGYQYRSFLVEVEDTGVGIGQEHIPHLFERFYRVDKGRSRSMGGTGLGLSVVKHIVELYQGRITVESTPGRGTIMKLRFPDRR